MANDEKIKDINLSNISLSVSEVPVHNHTPEYINVVNEISDIKIRISLLETKYIRFVEFLKYL